MSNVTADSVRRARFDLRQRCASERQRARWESALGKSDGVTQSSASKRLRYKCVMRRYTIVSEQAAALQMCHEPSRWCLAEARGIMSGAVCRGSVPPRLS
eukprot:5747141-Pyramimonas_sp.AAC.1